MRAIDEVIDELLQESKYLEEQLKISIEEWLFEEAELYRRSLLYTNERIRILNNLNDFNFDKKQYFRSTIEKTRAKLKNEKYQKQYPLLEEKIVELESKLTKLNQIDTKYHEDNDLIIFLLDKLIRNKIKNLQLRIGEDSIIIEIQKIEGIKITIRPNSKKDLSGYLSKRAKVELKKIGFSNIETLAEYRISKIDSQIRLTILELLSRLAYDVFYQYGNLKGTLVYEMN